MLAGLGFRPGRNGIQRRVQIGRKSRTGIGAIAAGAVLLIAAVVGFVVVPEHAPAIRGTYDCLNNYTFKQLPASCMTGLSRTAYDAARIGTWALLIVGALLVVIGLTGYARPQAQR